MQAHFRVGSLNCECLRDGAELGAAVLSAERDCGSLDVLALQEVSTCRDKQLSIFAEDLGMRVVVRSTPDAEVGLANALLVRLDGPSVAAVNSWVLRCWREDRSAVALELPTLNLSICCTHLDHREERARLNQLKQLRGQLCQRSDPVAAPLLLVGDFNAIRRADYDDAEWAAIIRGRAQAGIETETAVVEELELPGKRGGSWGLADCRAQATRKEGPTATSCFGARVDYVWASAPALRSWRVVSSAHIKLEPEGVTDHCLVVCELAPISELAPQARGGGAAVRDP